MIKDLFVCFLASLIIGARLQAGSSSGWGLAGKVAKGSPHKHEGERLQK